VYLLSNWTIVHCRTRNGDELMRLRGEVFGHPRYADGEDVTISTLRSCHQEGDTLSVTTLSGTEYVLGKPHHREIEAVDCVLRQLQAQGVAGPEDEAGHEGTKISVGGSGINS
jgi:hypothetical protein